MLSKKKILPRTKHSSLISHIISVGYKKRLECFAIEKVYLGESYIFYYSSSVTNIVLSQKILSGTKHSSLISHIISVGYKKRLECFAIEKVYLGESYIFDYSSSVTNIVLSQKILPGTKHSSLISHSISD